MHPMLAIMRFRYDEQAAAIAQADLTRCLEGLSACAGFRDGAVGRNLDDPGLWVLQTGWDTVGSYRRALSSYQIKMTVVPLLSQAVDEPSAYEVLVGEGATVPNEPRARGTVS